MIGDIVGRPGREFLYQHLDTIITAHQIDFIIANGENCSGGLGISSRTANELFSHRVDVITSGNHIWRNKDILKIIDTEQRILRPYNYPDTNPGSGYRIFQKNGTRILVVNLLGRINLYEVDCPFRKIDRLLNTLTPDQYDLSFLDFHSETTSEKVAMGFFLDGRIGAVVGTHTHVQTSDEKILGQGTAYLTDVGMTGSFDSVIGVDKEVIIRHFLTRMPIQYKIGESKPGINSVIIQFDIKQKKAISIQRLNIYS
ncbi:MAG: TIGR00282 family metallophosphoesterase [bacterium]|nr:TIGR00282 family metallophosphoesterase [bacterium]